MNKQRFKRFFSYYKPYKGLFCMDILCAVAVAALSLLFPLLVRYITKDILESGLEGALPRIAQTGALMLVFALIQAGCTFFYDAKGHTMGAMMERDMREELFNKMERLSFSFHDGQTPGRLMSRITNDLLSLAELYHHGPEDIIIYLVKFIGAFAILLQTNVRMTLGIAAFLPLVIVFVVIFNFKLLNAYKKNLERIGDVNTQVEESLSGVRMVQSFANEGLEASKFKKVNELFFKSRRHIYHMESYLYTGMDTLIQLLTIGVVVFGGMQIVGGGLDLPDLLTFILYAGYLTDPIRELIRVTQQYQEGLAGFKRFMDVMEMEPAIKDKQAAVELRDVKGDIELKNVDFRYEDAGEYVLKGINLKVKAGESVALVGSSGVGKTTLCSLIPRFYDVENGQVLIDGLDVRDVALHSLRRNIGIVQQEIYLFTGSVFENIVYGKPGASRDEVIQAAKRAGAHDFIMGFPDGYETKIGHRGIRLSGGQRQRLGIARVFLKNPPVIILDEATSSLDMETERIIQSSFLELSKGRTSFVIAHRLSTIQNAQRIIVLSDSGIEEEGSHEELISKGGTYARFFTA